MRKGPCTKPGGVCSFQLYVDARGSAVPAKGPGAGLRVLCPRRFEEDMEITRWVGETILGTRSPRIVTEIGFLRAREGSRHVGRIDMVLADESSASGQFEWCALEVQAVYFSGPSMSKEFDALALSRKRNPPFPSHVRRPDYRSSGPKRLMPQLQMKVPTLRRWGKKMAVVVDSHFFASLGTMEQVTDLSSGDIVWFTVDFEEVDDGEHFRLVRDKVYVTTLERATEGLMGASPVTQVEFENDIRAKLQRS